MDVTGEPESEGTASGQVAPPDGVSRAALVVSVLVATILAGVAGLAVGWKVEQHRVKDDVARIYRDFSATRPVGTVTAVTDRTVTVDLLSTSGTRTYALTGDTVVDSSLQTGDLADVVEGSTILVETRRVGGTRRLEALEIIVLPDSTAFGEAQRNDG